MFRSPSRMFLHGAICFRLAFSLVAAVALFSQVKAQSDPSQFITIINVPPDGAPLQLESNTQFNLMDGGQAGQINRTFEAGLFDGSSENVEVNISGGSMFLMRANAGSTVNVLDGTVTRLDGALGSVARIRGGFTHFLRAFEGSDMVLSGGVVESLFALEGGVEIVGNEFLFNGQPYSGDTISLLDSDDFFTGTLADGTPILFSPSLSDRFSVVELVRTDVPAVDPSALLFDGLDDPQINGLREGQRLTVDGGTLPNSFKVVGADVNLINGSIRSRLELYNSTMSIRGGTLARDARVLPGSKLFVSGGEIEGDFGSSGAEIRVSGGAFRGNLVATSGSKVEMTDGSISFALSVGEGSTADVSGGFIGRFDAGNDSTINITGGRIASNSIARSGSTVNISGGTSGNNIEAQTGSVINFSGGQFQGSGFNDHVRVRGGDVNVSGDARLGRVVVSSSRSEVNVYGGEVGGGSWVAFGTMNVFGGSIGQNLIVSSQGILNMRGGSIEAGLSVSFRGTVNLFMQEAIIDGTELSSAVGEPIVIPFTTGTVLTGVLADGSPLEFLINSESRNVFLNDFAVLTVTLIPEPRAVQLLLIACLTISFQRNRCW